MKKIIYWLCDRLDNLLGYPNCPRCNIPYDVGLGWNGYCWACGVEEEIK